MSAIARLALLTAHHHTRTPHTATATQALCLLSAPRAGVTASGSTFPGTRRTGPSVGSEPEQAHTLSQWLSFPPAETEPFQSW